MKEARYIGVKAGESATNELSHQRERLIKLGPPYTMEGMLAAMKEKSEQAAVMVAKTALGKAQLASSVVASTSDVDGGMALWLAAHNRLTQAQDDSGGAIMHMRKVLRKLEHARLEYPRVKDLCTASRLRLAELQTAGQATGSDVTGPQALAWVSCVVDPVRHGRLEPTAAGLADHYSKWHVKEFQPLAAGCPFNDLHWIPFGVARKLGVEGDKLYQSVIKGLNTHEDLVRKCQQHVDGMDGVAPCAAGKRELAQDAARFKATLDDWLARVRKGRCTGRHCECGRAECPILAQRAEEAAAAAPADEGGEMEAE